MSFSANLVTLLAVLFLVAVGLALRQIRRQSMRLNSLERTCLLPSESSASVRCLPAPLLSLVTAPRLEWEGRRYEVGFYRCELTGRDRVADFVATVVLDADCPVIYWGAFPDAVAQELLRRGLKKKQDPRGKVAMPLSAAEVEHLLLSPEWHQVWLVSEGEARASQLAAWQRRFGCGAMAFCGPE